MFGGCGLYVDDLFIAIIVGDTLYLKADEPTRTAFELPQRILWQWLDDFVLVTDDEIRKAQRTLIIETRNLVEAAGAAPLAAAFQLRERIAGKRIALVVSGGNVTREQILDVLSPDPAVPAESRELTAKL